MKHEDALNLLFPIEIIGNYQADIALEGKQFDNAQDSASQILVEMFPDGAYSLLTDWERVCGITLADDATLQMRRDAVIRKLRERGGLSIPYFISLAAIIGWEITIDELMPFMCAWNRAGDRLYSESSRWIWQVNATGYDTYSFRAGRSVAGERLAIWPAAAELEELFNNLKPAHTYVTFIYES